MITGAVRWVVVQLDTDNTIFAVWGPFPSESEAVAWAGIPGHEGTYRTESMRSAPQWFEETSVDEENS